MPPHISTYIPTSLRQRDEQSDNVSFGKYQVAELGLIDISTSLTGTLDVNMNIVRRKDILITITFMLMSATCTITLLAHLNPLIHYSNASTCISVRYSIHMSFYSAFIFESSDL